ncbi:hypothetical protein M3689_18485 [Alkalihalophilus marmarensis]|jgi:heme/copper-type cytochrome/quinol oxidase subunit 2|uniref:Uncharacterized protein n=1 Tax=Alkalihalophilus marmarensis DSM 21297 TaxID=1188261 RepID=U6SJ41_9BACI|nr:hypothetical protein [Alkalihalophilus marmarensis]ERN51744.1 hypothetical protein A33I_01120 [Alkalihalophilus marmarensis DSM 21297]MCM3491291.1 hypothetical protein [Alkalihalophilus marmarensis]
MNKDKQSLLKSVHAAFIIGKIMAFLFGLLIVIIFVSDARAKSEEEWIVIVISWFIVSFLPIAILHIIHKYIFLKKYPECKKK